MLANVVYIGLCFRYIGDEWGLRTNLLGHTTLQLANERSAVRISLLSYVLSSV